MRYKSRPLCAERGTKQRETAIRHFSFASLNQPWFWRLGGINAKRMHFAIETVRWGVASGMGRAQRNLRLSHGLRRSRHRSVNRIWHA
jgi:hypothetical protein